MEINEDFNTVEQLNIPHTLPHLLRQYAKAAIRTQPADLLKWSATYFRCLSINCAPPVKTRLEYPVPEDWEGLTSGWVHSLYQQFNGSPTVEFEVLLDRWSGACLHIPQLIQILYLGKFDDPSSVPCLKFIGLCAGIISKSLTHTMVLVCEVLTEEPEGGSAAMSAEIFLNIYKFLAEIDASEGQWLKNKYFPINLVDFVGEKRVKFGENVQSKENVCIESVVHQPSEDESKGQDPNECFEDANEEGKDISHYEDDFEAEVPHQIEYPRKTSKKNTIHDEEFPDDMEQNEHEDEEENHKKQEEILQQVEDDSDKEGKEALHTDNEDENCLEEEREEKHYKTETDGKSHVDITSGNEGLHDDDFEDVFIDPVPGIGPKVPAEMVEEFENYVRSMAKVQNGMIMPRNLKNFKCPHFEEFISRNNEN